MCWSLLSSRNSLYLSLKNDSRFRPRILIDVSRINMATNVLGFNISMPIMIAPSAMQKMAHPEGLSKFAITDFFHFPKQHSHREVCMECRRACYCKSSSCSRNYNGLKDHKSCWCLCYVPITSPMCWCYGWPLCFFRHCLHGLLLVLKRLTQ